MEEEGKNNSLPTHPWKNRHRSLSCPSTDKEKICIVLSCLSCMPNEPPPKFGARRGRGGGRGASMAWVPFRAKTQFRGIMNDSTFSKSGNPFLSPIPLMPSPKPIREERGKGGRGNSAYFQVFLYADLGRRERSPSHAERTRI